MKPERRSGGFSSRIRNIRARSFKLEIPPPGVYILLCRGKCVYVGRSINIIGRLVGHAQYEYDEVLYLPCDDENISVLESYVWHYLMPFYGQCNSYTTFRGRGGGTFYEDKGALQVIEQLAAKLRKPKRRAA